MCVFVRISRFCVGFDFRRRHCIGIALTYYLHFTDIMKINLNCCVRNCCDLFSLFYGYHSSSHFELIVRSHSTSLLAILHLQYFTSQHYTALYSTTHHSTPFPTNQLHSTTLGHGSNKPVIDLSKETCGKEICINSGVQNFLWR